VSLSGKTSKRREKAGSLRTIPSEQVCGAPPDLPPLEPQSAKRKLRFSMSQCMSFRSAGTFCTWSMTT